MLPSAVSVGASGDLLTGRDAVTAATAAGFTDSVFTPEPTAAAAYFSHILGHDIPDGHGVVVFDLSGGTFDASVVASRNKTVEVLAAAATPQDRRACRQLADEIRAAKDSKRGPVGAAEPQSATGPWAGVIVFFVALIVFTVLIVAMTS